MKEYLTFDDVLMVPRYNKFPSRGDERISTSVKLGNFVFNSPLISANMDTITGSEMAKKMSELGGLGILHRFCSIEDNVKMFKDAVHWSYHDSEYHCHVGVSVGVNEGLERAKALYDAGARIFCVDVAHGHSKACGTMIKDLREMTKFKDPILIIAGNVCTLAGADYLVGCGADAIKVGIGPGGVCETRIKTGVGAPQLSAIIECARCSRPIIADGGCRTPGDVCKALAAGATMVMLGSMLAGTDETPGEAKVIEGLTPLAPPVDGIYNVQNHRIFQDFAPTYVKYKVFRGMASKEANEDQFGVMADWKTAEGISTTVPCKGPVENVIKDIMGGVRSAMTYNGAENITELQRAVEFVRVTPAGNHESKAHIQ